MAENTIFFTPSQGTSREKYSYKKHQRQKCRLWWEINTSLSIYSLTGRVFPICRQRMDGLNPSEMDIQVLIPSPTSSFTDIILFPNWEEGKQIVHIRKTHEI